MKSRPSPGKSRQFQNLQFTDCIGKLIQHPSGLPPFNPSCPRAGDRPAILAPASLRPAHSGAGGDARPHHTRFAGAKMAVRCILVPNWVARTQYLLYPEARLANRTRLSDARRCTGGFVLGGIVVGLVSRLLIAEQIWDTLVPNRGLHGISDADRAWFMFGALGPAIGDFIPSGAPPAGAPAGATGPRSPYYSVWQNAFELAVGNPAKKLPDLVSTITTLQQGIDQLATIVANHDFGAARAFQQSSLPGIQTASNDLNTIISNFAGGAQLSTIGGLV